MYVYVPCCEVQCKHFYTMVDWAQQQNICCVQSKKRSVADERLIMLTSFHTRKMSSATITSDLARVHFSSDNILGPGEESALVLETLALLGG